MDSKKNSKLGNPAENTNIISYLFFIWIIPLFRKGYKQDLGMDDMYSVLKDDSSKSLGDRLEK